MDIPRVPPKTKTPDSGLDPESVKGKFGESKTGFTSQTDQIEPQQPADIFSSAVQQAAGTVEQSGDQLVALFQDTISALAQNEESFNDALRDTLGPLFRSGVAQEIRSSILKGDFSWTPGINFAPVENGILDSESFVVQIPAQFASSPARAALSYVKSLSDFVAGPMFQNRVSSDALMGSMFQGAATGQNPLLYDDAVELNSDDPLMQALEFGGRLADVVKTIVANAGALMHGGAMSFAEGFTDTLDAFGLLFSGKPLEALGKVGENAMRPFQNFFDASAVLLVNATSAIQVLLGAEKPGRSLTESEISTLRTVYGDSLNYDEIRVKEDVGGILGGQGRAFTIGNTIFIPEGTTLRDPLLIHEAAHAWQFQHGGLDYISDALIGRYLGGEGYNVGLALVNGKSWEELNPEQQAALLEEVFRNRFFEDSENKRFLIRLNQFGGPDTGGGFDVLVVEEGSPEYDAAIEDGFTDATDQVNDGLDQTQSGTGAT